MPSRLQAYLAVAAVAGALSYKALPLQQNKKADAASVFATAEVTSEALQQAGASDPASELCLRLGADIKAGCLSRLPGAKVHSAIMTVADPRRTNLGLLFDRSVEAAIWALGDVNYTFQSYWLPWPSPGSKDSDGDGTNATGGDKGDARASGSGSYTRVPGFLLFRNHDTSESFVVWLVGESPTQGIEKGALRAAIQDVEQYNHDPGRLRIIAPSFSGGFLSLGDVLKDYNGQLGFRVLTGMATSLEAEKEFAEASPNISFGATVENASNSVCEFVQYLRDQRLESGELAILAEDQTVFGQQVQTIPCIQQKSAKEQWLLMRFPREIAHLRDVSEEKTSSAGGATSSSDSAQSTTAPASQTLPFTLKSPADTRDNVPIYSPTETPLSQEAVLLDIANALQHEHVRYAALIATDVLDQIFLARFLRRACPDVRLIVFDADLLFARAQLSSPLEGILNVTTYPLFLRNQHWTTSELAGGLPRRIPFTSRAAEGVYNAVRAQLWESGIDAAGEVMLDYWPPNQSDVRYPPLWLTVLGRTGYWPVALLNQNDQRDFRSFGSYLIQYPKKIVPNEKLHPERPSNAWRVMIIIVSLLGLANCLYLWWVYEPYLAAAAPRLTKPSWAAVLLYRLFPIYPHERRTNRRNGRLLRFNTLLLPVILALMAAEMVLAYTGVPYAMSSSGATIWTSFWFFWIPLVTSFLLLVTAVQLVAGSREKVASYVAFVVWLAFAALWATVFRGWNFDDMRVFFFAYRSSHPTSGVSPVFPVLLLVTVWFLWGLMQLWRKPNQDAPRVPLLQDARRSAIRLNTWFAKLVPNQGMLLLIILVSSTVIRIHSFENIWYDLVVNLLAGASYFLMFSAWGQLLGAWARLRRFLECLERHPVREAFSRLPKELATVPLFQSSHEKPYLMASARCYDVLSALVACPVENQCALDRVLVDARDQMRKRYKSLLELQSKSPAQKLFHSKDLSEAKSNMERLTRFTADHLIRGARKEYWNSGLSESLKNEEAKRENHAELSDGGKRRILVEEFIALRFSMYIFYAVDQMKKLMWFVVAAYVLTVMALNVYPFQSSRLIDFSSVIVFLALSAGTVAILADMDRNSMLSRLTNTTPNQIGKDFFLRAARFGALPLLTILSTEFPSIRNLLFSWIEPALQALATNG